ncbi:hypothetical protein CC2G_004047 [Coprinopsis cinerea AmutBmut pab1-1]|nr:hypothetical protein CC2G_004047 [Coprinopsis cinerea AmutBmut pab1-1]
MKAGDKKAAGDDLNNDDDDKKDPEYGEDDEEDDGSPRHASRLYGRTARRLITLTVVRSLVLLQLLQAIREREHQSANHAHHPLNSPLPYGGQACPRSHSR